MSRLAEELCGPFAERYGITPEELLILLKKTAFNPGKDKGGKPRSDFQDSEIVAALLVAKQYELNPFLKEIYLIRDERGGFIVVVSIDGWAKVIANARDFDGLETEYGEDERGEFCRATIHRKSLGHPVTIVEYMKECKRKMNFDRAPWNTHPWRMLRHKAIQQAGRLAFGLSFVDPDEAANIRANEVIEVAPALPDRNPAEQVPTQVSTPPRPKAKAGARRVKAKAPRQEPTAAPPPGPPEESVEERLQAVKTAIGKMPAADRQLILDRLGIQATNEIEHLAHIEILEGILKEGETA